jgi:FkbM family methyltransferase
MRLAPGLDLLDGASAYSSGRVCVLQMRRSAEPVTRRGLKALRRLAPVNYVATHVVRSVMKGLGKSPAWPARHLHRVGSVTATLPNGRVLRLWSRGDDWISNQIFWRGWAGHEPDTTTVFFALAQKASAVVDVGAYVGYYALLAAHANPAARVLALEPLPAIYARLVRHVSLNGPSNVECLMMAAGAREEVATFYHHSHELPTSSSLSRDFMIGIEDLGVSPVPVVTVDRLVRERSIPRVDLVKIDTESTEPDVLQGMRETIARDRPWIVCEVLKGRGAEERLAPMLEPYGYRFYLLTSEGPLPKNRIEGHPQWLNYLFGARDEKLPCL